MVRRDGARVRLFTRSGHDWAARYPAIHALRAVHDGTRTELGSRWGDPAKGN